MPTANKSTEQTKTSYNVNNVNKPVSGCRHGLCLVCLCYRGQLLVVTHALDEIMPHYHALDRIYCCQKLSGIHTVYINGLLNIVPYRCMFVYYLLTIYVKALFSLCTKALSGAEQSISLLENLTIGRQTNTLLFFAPL